jgi:hypothetical protein
MWTNSTMAGTTGFSRKVQYVLVNHRIPRTDPHCVLCGQRLQSGYVRELQANLLYCDRLCLAGHAEMKARWIEPPIRRAS